MAKRLGMLWVGETAQYYGLNLQVLIFVFSSDHTDGSLLDLRHELSGGRPRSSGLLPFCLGGDRRPRNQSLTSVVRRSDRLGG